MGGISVGGGHGNRKSVDAEVSLLPTIDLLLCCVMFLLVTAVWNRLARVDVDQQVAGAPTIDAPPPEERIVVYLHVSASGYTLASTAGDRLEIPRASPDEHDLSTLRDRLTERRRAQPGERDLVVTPDDGVPYEDVIAAVDTAVGAGFTGVSLSDRAPI